MVGLQVVLLGAPTSLASIMVIGPHHAAVTHVGGASSEVGQREHMVRLGIHRKCWSEFLCLGGYLPCRAKQVGGDVPRGMRPAATPSPTPAGGPTGGPVAGAPLGMEPLDHTRKCDHAGYWLFDI
jgi:hypothetical protein